MQNYIKSFIGNTTIHGYKNKDDTFFMGGSCKSWRISKAHKDGVTQDGSIFMVEKKKLKQKDKKLENKELYQRNSDNLKREATNLAKFKHPSILQILEPVFEDNNCIAFVTEPVEKSLADIIDNKRDEEIRCDEVELKLHLLELIEGLIFLNETTKTVHLNLCPDNIFITTSGNWKIGGFGFMIQQQQGDITSDNITLSRAVIENTVNPSIQYCGPEFFDPEAKFTIKSDMVSQAMIFYTLFSYKKEKSGRPEYLPLDLTGAKERSKQVVADFYKTDFLTVFPEGLKDFIKKCLSNDHSQRPVPSDQLSNAWINDMSVRGIYNLGDFYKLEDTKQKMYLKGLAKMIPNYTSKILRVKIIPFIEKEITTEKNNAELISILIYILEKKLIPNKLDQKELIWPIFKKLIHGKKISGQVLYLIISFVKVVCELLARKEIEENIIGLFYKCFDCKVSKIQRLCIKRATYLSEMIDYSEVKNKIFPRILLLCNDTDQAVKREALRFTKTRLSIIDTTFIQNNLLNVLSKCLQSDNTPATNMLILEILRDVSKNLTTDVIAGKVLPIMIPFLVNKRSSKSEFSAFLMTIRNFQDQVETNRNLDFQNQPGNQLDNGAQEDDEIFTEEKIETIIENAQIDQQLINVLFGVERKSLENTTGVPSNNPVPQNSNMDGFFDFSNAGTTKQNPTIGNLAPTIEPKTNPVATTSNISFNNTNTNVTPNTNTNMQMNSFDLQSKNTVTMASHPIYDPFKDTISSNNQNILGFSNNTGLNLGNSPNSNKNAFDGLDNMGSNSQKQENTIKNNNLFGGMNMTKKKAQNSTGMDLTGGNNQSKVNFNPTLSKKSQNNTINKTGNMNMFDLSQNNNTMSSNQSNSNKNTQGLDQPYDFSMGIKGSNNTSSGDPFANLDNLGGSSNNNMMNMNTGSNMNYGGNMNIGGNNQMMNNTYGQQSMNSNSMDISGFNISNTNQSTQNNNDFGMFQNPGQNQPKKNNNDFDFTL